jgi:AcrR family transcriptional regulator
MTSSTSALAGGPATGDGRPLDRRARRRQETIEEIIGIATEVMTEYGVNGLSLAEVARRLGVQPPSLYKYFPSLAALHDALFRRGHERHLEAMRQATAKAEPGIPALIAALEASGRWALANGALAQLMFWRPVPGFSPSPEAFAPSAGMVALQRSALADAVAAGQVGPEADSDDACYLLGILISGVVNQHLANEPELPWEQGRFTRQFPRLMRLFVAGYPPAPAAPVPEEERAIDRPSSPTVTSALARNDPVQSTGKADG